MIKIEFLEDEIVVIDKERQSFSNYFLKLNSDIINCKKTTININTFYKNIFNFNDILYLNDLSKIVQVIEYFKTLFKSSNYKIDIYSSATINNEIKKYFIENNINYIKKDDIFCNLELFLKHTGYNPKDIYKLIKKYFIEYIFKKYTKELGDIDLYEKSRVESILKVCFIDIFYDLNKVGESIVKVKTKTKENKIKNIKIDINNCDVKKIKIIEDIACNKKIDISEIIMIKEEFKVTMISPFSYGKSTILNALIGNSVLKTDLRAETAVITKIMNDKGNNIVALYNNNDKKYFTYNDDDDLNEKIKLITSAREDGNSIKEVLLEYNYNSLPNITLVDSPGLFSRYEHHNEISMKALNESDMIIFVIDPSKVGEKNFSQVLKDNMQEILKYKKYFCFVLSKLDLYELDEERIINELNIVLDELGFNYVPIFFVSGYFGLKAQMLKNKKIDLMDVRKDRNIFVMDGEDILSGKLIEEHHWKNLWEFSRIENLINYILDIKEKHLC